MLDGVRLIGVGLENVLLLIRTENVSSLLSPLSRAPRPNVRYIGEPAAQLIDRLCLCCFSLFSLSAYLCHSRFVSRNTRSLKVPHIDMLLCARFLVSFTWYLVIVVFST